MAAGAQAAGPRPIVIAHRGASGERPEHTRAAYLRAVEQGADFIEPDLVMSRDGVLIIRHENDLSETTDVAGHAAFAARRTEKVVDGRRITGWFAEDFTLDELKALRCKERLPALRPRNTAFDGHDDILSFEEGLAIAREAGVGIYPELKHPTYLAGLGLDPVPAFVRAVEGAGMNARSAPIFAQCFEIGALERLKAMAHVRRVFLMAPMGGPVDRPGVKYRALAADPGAIAAFADGIGVEKTMIVPRAEDGRSAAPTDLITRAHAAGLLVHVWTFRAENVFLPVELRRGEGEGAHGDLGAELAQHFALGVDGVFSDFPAAAVAARGR